MTTNKELLMEKSLKDLRIIAKERGIKGISELRKEQIADLIAKDYETKGEEVINAPISEESVTENSSKEESIPCVPSIPVSESDFYLTRTATFESKIKHWGGKDKSRHYCSHCGKRIYNPQDNNFCFNCGFKLDKSSL